MPDVAAVVRSIEGHFRKRRVHTAQVLTGPKRETWFSAECFVALAQRRILKEEFITYWGERTYSTLTKVVEARPGLGELARLFDLVAVLPGTGDSAVSLIIENKLILGDEGPGQILQGLKKQMLNARKICSEANVLGNIFFAAVTYQKKPKYSDLLKGVTDSANSIFLGSEGFQWVESQKVRKVFDAVSSGFAYPAMHFSLVLCAVELPPLALDGLPQSTIAPIPAGPGVQPVLRSLRTRPQTPKPPRSPKRIASS